MTNSDELLDTITSIIHDPFPWYIIILSFLVYLFLAFFTYRRDREKIMERGLCEGVDMIFFYGWSGVYFRVYGSEKKRLPEEKKE